MPESQISPVREELVSLKEKSKSPKEFAKPSKYIKNSNKGNRNDSQLEVKMVSKYWLIKLPLIESLLYMSTERSIYNLYIIGFH